MTAKWARLGWPAGSSAEVRDLSAHKDLGRAKDEFTVEVPSHGVAMLKAAPQNLPAQQSGPHGKPDRGISQAGEGTESRPARPPISKISRSALCPTTATAGS